MGFWLSVCILLGLSAHDFIGHPPEVCPRINKPHFTIVYDSRSKVPWFVHEHLAQESKNRSVDRQVNFLSEKLLYPLHRSQYLDYKGSEYVRGHMAPARDFQFSESAMSDTFSYANVCPQAALMNAQIWQRLEEHIRRLLDQFEVLDVFTGPLFLPHEENGKKYIKYEVIGEGNVAVPTHLFKVVFKTKAHDPEAYIIPNTNEVKSNHFAEFSATLVEIERYSGIEFFPKEALLR